MVALRGGLGNQLFGWAYGESQRANGARVRFDANPQFGRGLAVPALIGKGDSLRVSPRIWRAASRGHLSWIPRFELVTEESSARVPERGSGLPALRLHLGYWQSLDYFAHCEGDIRARLIERIGLVLRAQEDYCAVHVRRGDYISDPGAAATLGALDADYYREAIDHMHARGIHKFRVFTDDPEWATQNIVPISSGIEVSPAGSMMTDFAGIAMGASVIMANSSFSWWGAFLNDRPTRPVVAPQRWFRDSDLNSERLVPDRWIKIGTQ